MSLAANTFVLRGSNAATDNRPPRSGSVDYQAPEVAPFFEIFWFGIRMGLLDLVVR